jgi:hypothetical protein
MSMNGKNRIAGQIPMGPRAAIIMTDADRDRLVAQAVTAGREMAAWPDLSSLTDHFMTKCADPPSAMDQVVIGLLGAMSNCQLSARDAITRVTKIHNEKTTALDTEGE